MARLTLSSADRRRSWRGVLARAMALLLFLAFSSSFPAAANEFVIGSASPVITSSANDAGHPAGGQDDAVVQHTQCSFHHGTTQPETLIRIVLNAGVPGAFPVQGNLPPRSRPAALPFKPPRA